VMAATVAQQRQRQLPPITRQFFVQPPVLPANLPTRFGGPFAPPPAGVLHHQQRLPLPPPPLRFMLPPRPTGFLPPQLQQQQHPLSQQVSIVYFWMNKNE
jgi:hypothetical protein